VKTPLDMIDRPIAMILFALILLVIALHIRTLVREYRNPPKNPDTDIHATQGGQQ
jgi:putative tricarboxylic transport membrane protein